MFFEESLFHFKLTEFPLMLEEKPENVLKLELCARMRPAEKCRAFFSRSSPPRVMTYESCSSLCASDRNNLCSGFL